jgi:hypothetical protein
MACSREMKNKMFFQSGIFKRERESRCHGTSSDVPLIVLDSRIVVPWWENAREKDSAVDRDQSRICQRTINPSKDGNNVTLTRVLLSKNFNKVQAAGTLQSDGQGNTTLT